MKKTETAVGVPTEQEPLITRLHALARSNPLLQWQMAHGSFGGRVKAVVATAMGYTPAIAGQAWSILHDCMRAGMMEPATGQRLSVRGHMSGTLQSTANGSALGKEIAAAMRRNVEAAETELLAGKLPVTLLCRPLHKEIPGSIKGEHGIQWFPDFRIVRATCSHLGLEPRKASAVDMMTMLQDFARRHAKPEKGKVTKMPAPLDAVAV